MSAAFCYRRRVQFAETDLAGIVHFSWMFRYMEEAEHALFRAAGLSVVDRINDIGWPRVLATFEFQNPLFFEDEFEVLVRLEEIGRRSLNYRHTILRGDTTIGTGTMTAVCARRTPDGLESIELPEDLVVRLRAAIAR